MWLSNFREGKEIVHTMFLPRETILIYSLLLGDTKLEKKICFLHIFSIEIKGITFILD